VTAIVIAVFIIGVGLFLILRPATATKWIAELARSDHPALLDYPVTQFQLRESYVVAIGVAYVFVGVLLILARI